MSGNQDPAAIGAEIQSVIQKMGALSDANATAQARELVRLLMTLYGAGLARILDIVRTEQGGPSAVVDRFAGDGLVASLLVLHDLHPHPVELRVERALAALQPHFPPQMQIALTAVTGDAAHVRVDRSPSGAGGSTDVVRMAVERAIQEAAPEIATIHIEGLADGAAQTLIQIVRAPRAAGPSRPVAS